MNEKVISILLAKSAEYRTGKFNCKRYYQGHTIARYADMLRQAPASYVRDIAQHALDRRSNSGVDEALRFVVSALSNSRS